MKALRLLLPILAFVVMVLGAYTRLKDAGLGCPDWPGCYGRAVAPAASSAAPGQEVDIEKAWLEMIHRYAAASLGILVMAHGFLSWRRKKNHVLAAAAMVLVLFQAALGAWTVTMRLAPWVVMSHLLGGMLLFVLLLWLFWLEWRPIRAKKGFGFAPLLALFVVFLQIALGGWVSANYAALACPDFPTCLGQWWPEANWEAGFSFLRALGRTPQGDFLPQDALVAIHVAHRLGAMAVLVIAGGVAADFFWRQRTCRGLAFLGLVLILVQIGFGVATVLLARPLLFAAIHHATASLLLAVLAGLNYHHAYRRQTHES